MNIRKTITTCYQRRVKWKRYDYRSVQSSSLGLKFRVNISVVSQVLLHGQLGKSLILLNLLNDPCHQVLYFLIRQHGYCFFFATHFSVAIIRGQCLFFLKPADINDDWIGFTQAIRQRLLDSVSSSCSLSVVLSALETSCTTRTELPLA